MPLQWTRKAEKVNKQFILKHVQDFYNISLPINSETGSVSPSQHRIVPVISSFSTIGKNKVTNSAEYGGEIASKTFKISRIVNFNEFNKLWNSPKSIH